MESECALCSAGGLPGGGLGEAEFAFAAFAHFASERGFAAGSEQAVRLACFVGFGDDVLSDLAHPGSEVGAQLVDLGSRRSIPDLLLVVDTRGGVNAAAAVTHKSDLFFCFAADGSNRQVIAHCTGAACVITTRDVASRAIR